MRASIACADTLKRFRHPRFVGVLEEDDSEVSDDQHAILREEDVRRLNVSVNCALAVDGGDGLY
jgi:hypothetical protein